ncbi:phospholipase D-like domain-containing protein [Paraburkholderia bryophila]|uniref:phospholipase D-like domain-containing protein n=1 Tax=Paraburkholderia bryophila TaxID=420952 RepID=UPI00234AA5C0|nr:phospholipase D-like domain-containing protein [Paraburkholderia bryophila]WCM18700.1 phospholipase D-like domain-containing protein [Paraburkholderia bryophila]
MRVKAKAGGLVIQAVAGTHVVLLGWDIEGPELEAGLLGFSIRRTDETENETYWLRGMKTFPDTQPPLPPGGTASSQQAPFQTFQWGDYSAKPGHKYTYTLTAMYGQPGALVEGVSVTIAIATEKEDDGTHSVYFNRGAIASQEYARQFQDKAPDVVGDAAYAWLSRGLLEAITGFVAKAVDQSFGIRLAIYEFQWPAILSALHAAAGRGVSVSVIFDAIENAKEDPVRKNEEAIETTGIGPLCQGFTNGRIMHNKFMVLLKDGKPVGVLTGSTNYTENGIFGHLNCAHVVSDPDVAQIYLDYWTQLSEDPDLATMRTWDDRNTPSPANPPAVGVAQVFSPQTGTATLQRYADIAASTRRALFMTFAFGMNKDFLPAYGQDDGVLRFALMDKVGVGKNLAQAQQQIDAIRKIPGTVVAIGQNITLNSFDRWLNERDGLAPGEHVRWVHTKFMLVDPLSDDPIVITGSANFSDASIETNHENMLVIRGNTRVADIYLGEFMRQFSSYAFRDAAYDAQHGGKAEDFKPQDLATDASWINRYKQPGSSGALRKTYFSGE